MHQMYRVQNIGKKLIFFALRYIPEITHNINYGVVRDTKIRTTRDSIFRYNIKTSLSHTKKPVF